MTGNVAVGRLPLDADSTDVHSRLRPRSSRRTMSAFRLPTVPAVGILPRRRGRPIDGSRGALMGLQLKTSDKVSNTRINPLGIFKLVTVEEVRQHVP